MSTAGFTALFVGGSSGVSRDSECLGSSYEKLGAMQRPRWPINRANRQMSRLKDNRSDRSEKRVAVDRDYWRDEWGPGYRLEADIGETYADLMVK
jgi:hypothetical protein